MSKIGYLWIVGVYIAIGIFYLFLFRQFDVFSLFVIASIVIGVLLVGMIIRSKITGKVDDREFSNNKVIKGIIWAFLGIFVGFGLGLFFAVVVTPVIYGRFPEGAGFLIIPCLIGGAIGGAIGGYSRERKTGIIGGAIGGFIPSTLIGSTGGIMNGFEFGIVGAIAGASLGMIAGAIEGNRSNKIK